MQTKFYLFILSIFALVSCSDRQQRMINTVEGAIDDYNNGDSTMLIILIIGAIILGGLWLYSKMDE